MSGSKRDAVMRERDALWVHICHRYFEGVRTDYKAAGFPDLPSFVIHEIWKRTPREEPLPARDEESR